MVKTALFLSSSEYANPGHFWKFTRGFFPWAKMQKKSQEQKQVLKGGLFSGLGKGRK